MKIQTIVDLCELCRVPVSREGSPGTKRGVLEPVPLCRTCEVLGYATSGWSPLETDEEEPTTEAPPVIEEAPKVQPMTTAVSRLEKEIFGLQTRLGAATKIIEDSSPLGPIFTELHQEIEEWAEGEPEIETDPGEVLELYRDRIERAIHQIAESKRKGAA